MRSSKPGSRPAPSPQNPGSFESYDSSSNQLIFREHLHDLQRVPVGRSVDDENLRHAMNPAGVCATCRSLRLESAAVATPTGATRIDVGKSLITRIVTLPRSERFS